MELDEASEKAIFRLAAVSSGSINPMAAVFGGVVGQVRAVDLLAPSLPAKLPCRSLNDRSSRLTLAILGQLSALASSGGHEGQQWQVYTHSTVFLPRRCRMPPKLIPSE